MRITKKTYPQLLPRIVLWSLVVVLLGLISASKHWLGETKSAIAAGVVVLLAIVAMLVMRSSATRQNRD